MRLRLYIILYLQAIIASSFAQGLINVQHYSTENGLSQNIIQNMIQDDEDYIWFATRNGIEKFDGYTFKNYKSYPTDKVKLRYNRLIQLIKGGKHTIWCQTYDDKIYLFDTQREVFENVCAYHSHIKECTGIKRTIALENNVFWVAGNNGELWRFDENKYKEEGGLIYYPARSTKYHGDRIYTIGLDAYGNEWIFTDKGYFVHGKKELSGNTRFRFHTKVGGHFYMISYQGEFSTYTPNKGLQRIESPYKINGLRGLFPLYNNQLGIATYRGFIIYNTETKQFKEILLDEKEENIYPDVFYQAKDSTLWTFNGYKNVIHCNIETEELEFIDYKIIKEQKNSAFIHEDEYGYIWIFPTYGVLSCYNPKEKHFKPAYTYQDGKRKNYDFSSYRAEVRKFLLDSRRNLWHCCESGFNKISFPDGNYNYIPSTSHIEVRGLFIDSQKRIWLGDKDGKIEVYDNKRNYCGNLDSSGRLVKNKEVTFGANIYCFFEDEKQRIWMGSKENGLYIANPNGKEYQISHYLYNKKEKYSLNFNSIYSINKDNRGRIWIGTYGGGLNLVEGTFPNLRFIHPQNKLENYSPKQQQYLNVRSVYCTSKGIIMVGTTDGLITFSSDFQSPNQIAFHYNHCEETRAGSLANNDVLYIFESRTGEIYVVTYSGGISQIKSDNLLSNHIRFSHLNKRTGLPSDIAYAILEDKDGNLWISFETCICKYNLKQNTFETYDRFTLNPHSSISEAPPVIDEEQTMYVGTSQGTLYVSLNRLRKSTFVPPIVFTKVSVRKDDSSSKKVPIIDNTLVLEKNERNATITFAALDFVNIENLQYAYRLKGVSDEWVYIDKNHSANFVNLPSGNFTLEVKSTNGDGVWTENVTKLSMQILPTFWETGWAWSIYIIGTILSILLISGILTYIFNLKRKVSFEQQLTNLKLRFFTDISHELRTPLTLITAPVEEVLAQEKLSSKGHENMVVAKRNIDRMLRLINQLLDFRKIQNNKMKLYIEQTNVIALYKHTFDNFIGLASQRSIDFRFISNLESLTIYTDVDKLEKILFNLLSNAFKYTPDGKSIQLIIEKRDATLLFQVKDEGRGLDMRKIAILFNRFETLDEHNQSNSSGIGLSLVNEMVRLIHGTIKVESALGQGSTFTVSIPTDHNAFANDKNAEFILEDGNGKSVEEPTISTQKGANKELSILIVEDNEELRHFIVNILQEEYQVIAAADGVEGLEKLKSTIPDLVISDIMMPRMDGIELLDKTRKDHDISHIPFILLSAKVTLEDRIKGLEYGADDYITKPFSAGYLKARIVSLLKQRDTLRNFFTDRPKPEEEQQVQPADIPLQNLFPSAPLITNYDEEFIKKIVQSVEAQLENQDFKIENLADTMNLSRTVFYRKIKSILGVSPKDFVRDMRVKRAVQLLDTGAYSISEIAYMSGFSSPQYFSRVFREVMNCTPSEYKINEEQKDC